MKNKALQEYTTGPNVTGLLFRSTSLTLSAPLAGVQHQPGLGLLQLLHQPLVFALQLCDLLLPLLQHPQPGIEMEQTLMTQHNKRTLLRP